MQRRLLHEHSTSECENRIVQCEYCEQEFVFYLTDIRLHSFDKITRESYIGPGSVAFKPRHTFILTYLREMLLNLTEVDSDWSEDIFRKISVYCIDRAFD